MASGSGKVLCSSSAQHFFCSLRSAENFDVGLGTGFLKQRLRNFKLIHIQRAAQPDDARIPQALMLAEEQGMQIEFGEAQLKEAHPNTAQLYLQGQDGRSLEIIGQSLGGSRINIAEIDGIETNFSGDYPTLVVHNQDQPGHVAEVTSMLSHKGVNIAYMQLYRSSRGGEAVMVVECDQEIPKEGIDWLKKVEGVKKVTYLGHDTEAMDKGGTAR